MLFRRRLLFIFFFGFIFNGNQENDSLKVRRSQRQSLFAGRLEVAIVGDQPQHLLRPRRPYTRDIKENGEEKNIDRIISFRHATSSRSIVKFHDGNAKKNKQTNKRAARR